MRGPQGGSPPPAAGPPGRHRQLASPSGFTGTSMDEVDMMQRNRRCVCVPDETLSNKGPTSLEQDVNRFSTRTEALLLLLTWTRFARSSTKCFPFVGLAGTGHTLSLPAPSLTTDRSARALVDPQEKRLKGLGAAIPPHAAREAKRDREWTEFLDRRAPAPAPAANHVAQSLADKVCSGSLRALRA